MTVESFTLIGEPPIEMTFDDRWQVAMTVLDLERPKVSAKRVTPVTSVSTETNAGTTPDIPTRSEE